MSTQASQSVAAVLAELLAVHVVTSAASANLLLPDVIAADAAVAAVEAFAAVAYSVEAAVFVDWLCLEPLVASSQSPLMMMMMLVQHQTPTHKRK